MKYLDNLANWLGGLGLRRIHFALSLRVTLAALLALVAALFVGLPLPLWSVLTAVIVTQMSVGRTLKASIDYMLGTIGGKYQEFRQRIDLLIHIQQRRAQLFSERGSARLSRSHHLDAAYAQFAGQDTQLRRFSATVNSFKGDESAGHLCRWIIECVSQEEAGAPTLSATRSLSLDE